jgi:hypothetical protein
MPPLVTVEHARLSSPALQSRANLLRLRLLLAFGPETSCFVRDLIETEKDTA